MTRVAHVCALLALVGCGSGFERPSEVRGPRLLAIVVEPPSSAPGTDLVARAFTARPSDEPLTYRWRIDLGPSALARSAGQTLETSDAIIIEGEGDAFVIEGDETTRGIDALLAALGEAPIGTPEGVTRTVYERVGLEANLELTVLDTATGEVVVDGFKRIVLTPSTAGTNPPPPRFLLGERWISGRAGTVDPCIPEDGGDVPTVNAGEAITLEPEDDAAWLETYESLGLDGAPFSSIESGYYAWFSDIGTFSSDMTRAPHREVTWTAPETAGVAQMWIVVRDGHLGVSACRFAVDVR